jgi:hypothetical protein
MLIPSTINIFRLSHSISTEQIQNLTARMPEVLEEKCFLKCYGEGTDMVMQTTILCVYWNSNEFDSL